MIYEINMGRWTYLRNTEVRQTETTGKYLFFSSDRAALIELARKILKKYSLKDAKVPSEDGNIGLDYVLCIYDTVPRLKDELKQYASNSIRYTYWKSDEDTGNNKYSSKFREAKNNKKLF